MFQPIMRTSTAPASLHAYECLSRGPARTNLEQADVLFEYVRRKRIEAPADRACVTAALEAASAIPGTPGLSVNVHAITLATDHDFSKLLARVAGASGIATRRLTVEIVEHSPALDTAAFLRGLEHLRALDISIALDDVGLGESNYKMILDAAPDYLKIDKYFISHCDTEPRRRAIVESIADLAHRFGAEAIAEGVERPEELEALGGLGIDLIQGYLFSRPVSIASFRKKASVLPDEDRPDVASEAC
jgi:EAL domain-containing protein (putative c-di-GMP-specific phosphodiesterase class I)